MLKKRMTAALAAAGMVLALTACSSQEEQGAAQPEENAGVAVQVVEVTAETLYTENTTIGKITAEDEANIIVGTTAKCTAAQRVDLSEP